MLEGYYCLFVYLFIVFYCCSILNSFSLWNEESTTMKWASNTFVLPEMGVIYLINRGALPDWSVNQGEVSRVPAENVNFTITVVNMQQQKPPQLERSMKHVQRESRGWPNMTRSSCLFLREITRAEWDYNPGIQILELLQFPRWIWKKTHPSV